MGDSGAFQCALRGGSNILNSSEAAEITKKKKDTKTERECKEQDKGVYTVRVAASRRVG